MSFLKNEQNVYDVMQDTYITVLTHLQQLEKPERITAWINTIAVNKCKTFLTAVFLAEKQGLVIPDFLTSIFSAVFGTTAGTAIGVSAGISAGGAAGVIMHNRNKNTDTGTKNYREVDYTICDSDYMTVSIDKVYDIGCGPDDAVVVGTNNRIISENDTVLEYSITNHKDYMVYFNMKLLTSNNESCEGIDPNNWGVHANTTERFYLSGGGGVTFLDLGRKPTVAARILFCILEDSTGNGGPLYAVYSDIVDVNFGGDADSADYKRKFRVDGEWVVTYNDQVKVTYLGTSVYDEIEDKNSYSAWMSFYVENKTDHDLGVWITGDNTEYNFTLDLTAGTTGYITTTKVDVGYGEDDEERKNKAIVESGEPFPINVNVCDFTECYGGITTYQIYTL